MSKIKILVSVLALAVSGCELFEGRGDVSFSIASTNPVDDPDDRFDRVVIAVSKVVFVSSAGERETIEFDPAEQINLLDFTRGDSAALISSTSLPSAAYGSIELTIDSDEESNASFIRYRDSGDIATLFVPDEQQSKLDLPIDFKIEDGEITSLTLQFELRKSLQRQSFSLYELHPSLRLVLDDEAGAISGDVASSLIPASCDPAIYAFFGNDAPPNDIDTVGTGPVSTATVFQSNGGDGFVYSLEFLDEGPYTLALTCRAGDEDPTTSDDLEFLAETNVTVEAGETTEQDITP